MVREWRRVSLRALVDDKAVRLLCGGSLLHSHPLARDCRHQAASCSKTRRFTTRPPPSSLHSALSSPLHSLVSGACCVAPVLSLSLSLSPRPPFLSLSRLFTLCFFIHVLYKRDRNKALSASVDGQRGKGEGKREGKGEDVRAFYVGAHPIVRVIPWIGQGSGEGKGICVRHFDQDVREGPVVRSKGRGMGKKE